MFFSRSTWGIERQQTIASTLGKCQVPSGISNKSIEECLVQPNCSKSTSKKLPQCGTKSPPKASQNDMVLGHRGCTKFERMHRNLLSSGGAGGLPVGTMHPLWTVCPEKSTKCSKSRKICKNKSTYPHSARNTRKPLLGRGRPRRSGRSGQRGFTTPSKAPVTPFWKTPK